MSATEEEMPLFNVGVAQDQCAGHHHFSHDRTAGRIRYPYIYGTPSEEILLAIAFAHDFGRDPTGNRKRRQRSAGVR